MSGDIFARCVVLNHLRRPWRRDSLLAQAAKQGISRDRVVAVAEQIGVTEAKRHGEVWWERPATVVALGWWRSEDSRIYLRGAGAA